MKYKETTKILFHGRSFDVFLWFSVHSLFFPLNIYIYIYMEVDDCDDEAKFKFIKKKGKGKLLLTKCCCSYYKSHHLNFPFIHASGDWF